MLVLNLPFILLSFVVKWKISIVSCWQNNEKASFHSFRLLLPIWLSQILTQPISHSCPLHRTDISLANSAGNKYEILSQMALSYYKLRCAQIWTLNVETQDYSAFKIALKCNGAICFLFWISPRSEWKTERKF